MGNILSLLFHLYLFGVLFHLILFTALHIREPVVPIYRWVGSAIVWPWPWWQMVRDELRS